MIHRRELCNFNIQKETKYLFCQSTNCDSGPIMCQVLLGSSHTSKEVQIQRAYWIERSQGFSSLQVSWEVCFHVGHLGNSTVSARLSKSASTVSEHLLCSARFSSFSYAWPHLPPPPPPAIQRVKQALWSHSTDGETRTCGCIIWPVIISVLLSIQFRIWSQPDFVFQLPNFLATCLASCLPLFIHL